jgi:hypothetical protein
VVVGSRVDLAPARLVVEHRGRSGCRRLAHPPGDRLDRPARVPHLIHDQHGAALQQLRRRELVERRLGAATAVVVVELSPPPRRCSCSRPGTPGSRPGSGRRA